MWNNKAKREKKQKNLFFAIKIICRAVNGSKKREKKIFFIPSPFPSSIDCTAFGVFVCVCV